MSNLTVANYGDLVNATKVNYGPKKIQQIAQSYVDYVLFQLFFKKERMKEDGGQLIQRNLHLKKFPVARFKGIGQTDTVKIEDVTALAQVPWRFADTHWAFVDQDVMLCTNEHKIFDLIDTRRNNAMIDFIEMFEAALWQSPATTDTKTILGVPHFVTNTGASATFGHNGTVPSGYSTVANISPTDFPNWKNGNVTYTAVSKTDLIPKLRDAFFYCRFQNLESLKKTDYEANRDRYVCITNRSVSSDLEELGEAQNENLGRDVAVMEVNARAKDIFMVDGVLTIRRKPIITSQYLDGQSNNPFYGLALDYWCMYMHNIMQMKETEVLRVSDTHDSYYVAQDTWCNLLCLDRRRQFVATTS